MANFIPMNKWTEILKASKSGDEKAKAIVDNYMSDAPDFESLDRQMKAFYGIEEPKVEVEPKIDELPEDEELDAFEKLELPEDEEEIGFSVKEAPKEESISVQPKGDFFDDLDSEMKDLIDEDKIDEEDFPSFIKNKKKSALRAKKGAEYFKAFDPDTRLNYIANKENDYQKAHEGTRKQIERSYRDGDSAISTYIGFVTDLPEDGVSLDISSADSAYGDLTDDENAMGSFGRSWDEEDNKVMQDALVGLVKKYGKKNVSACLNTIKEDHEAWHKKRGQAMETAFDDYKKALHKLLK